MIKAYQFDTSQSSILSRIGIDMTSSARKKIFNSWSMTSKVIGYGTNQPNKKDRIGIDGLRKSLRKGMRILVWKTLSASPEAIFWALPGGYSWVYKK